MAEALPEFSRPPYFLFSVFPISHLATATACASLVFQFLHPRRRAHVRKLLHRLAVSSTRAKGHQNQKSRYFRADRSILKFWVPHSF